MKIKYLSRKNKNECIDPSLRGWIVSCLAMTAQYDSDKLKCSHNFLLRLICIFILATFTMPVIGQTQDSLSISATYKITGKVTDSAKKGFAGTRISVIGTRITAMTSEDGSFQIDVPYKDVLFFV